MTTADFTTLDWILFSAPAAIIVVSVVIVAAIEIVQDWAGR